MTTAYAFALTRIKAGEIAHMYVNPDGNGKFHIVDDKLNQVDKKRFATWEDGNNCRTESLDKAFRVAVGLPPKAKRPKPS